MKYSQCPRAVWLSHEPLSVAQDVERGNDRAESGMQGECSIDQSACQHSSSRIEDVIRMIKTPRLEAHEDAANQ